MKAIAGSWIITSATLFSGLITGAQELRLEIDSGRARQACSIVLPLRLDVRQLPAPAALQWTLTYPPEALSLAVLPGPAAAISQKQLHCSEANGSGTTTCLLLGINRETVGPGTAAFAVIQISPNLERGNASISVGNVVSADAAASPLAISGTGGMIEVEVSPHGPEPWFQAAGVTNAASGEAGPVAPGELVTIYGCGLGPGQGLQTGWNSAGVLGSEAGGSRVWFDEFPAPLLFVRNDQINAVVPFEIAGRGRVTLKVQRAGALSGPVPVNVVDTAPAVFTTDGTRNGQAAVVNEDLLPNSPGNPASAGSVVMIFATGAGDYRPTGTSGVPCTVPYPTPRLPVSVNIGGAEAEVTYAGCSPGNVLGLLQVNARVPAGVLDGFVPLILRAGSLESPTVHIHTSAAR
jgi:uncharacterized protein (TIGR03437 family)